MKRKNREVENFDAVRDVDDGDIPQTASAFEATGMMYKPPHDEAEYESLRQMHGLQAPYTGGDGATGGGAPRERRKGSAPKKR